LNSPELDAVLRLPIDWGLKSVSSFNATQISGALRVNGKSLSVEAFTYDKMGLVAMSYLTSSILNEIKPSIMFLTGICAAVSDSVRLGDIVVAESSWNWQSGKQHEADGFKFDSDSINGSANLIANAKVQAQSQDFRFKLMEIGQHIKSQKDILPNIHFGPMASGSVVVADSQVRENVVTQNRKVLALEMEAYAFYSAQKFNHSDGTKFLTIKGVCDRADPSKADELQILCSDRSAQFAKFLIDKIFV
jgi:nucleoside phosphorylase